MAEVRGKNTKSELVVRSALHRLGYRFRLHCRNLPGVPDIVLPKHHTIIFVHGCFCTSILAARKQQDPRHNEEFWRRKLGRNVEWDAGGAQGTRGNGMECGNCMGVRTEAGKTCGNHQQGRGTDGEAQRLAKRAEHIVDTGCSKYDVVDFFSGCGGMSDGFHKVGSETGLIISLAHLISTPGPMLPTSVT